MLLSKPKQKIRLLLFRQVLYIFRQVWSLCHLAATVITGKGECGGEPVLCCSDCKQEAGCDGSMASEWLDVTEEMSSKCIGCEAALFLARLNKLLQRSFVLFAEFDLYSNSCPSQNRE